jgi:hypothetical protein
VDGWMGGGWVGGGWMGEDDGWMGGWVDGWMGGWVDAGYRVGGRSMYVLNTTEVQYIRLCTPVS